MGATPWRFKSSPRHHIFLHLIFNVRYLTPMIRILLTLFTILSLTGCGDNPPPTPAASELEGILVSSAAPVAMENLQGQQVYLYFFPMGCEECWITIKKMNKLRDQFNLIGIVMYEEVDDYWYNVYNLHRHHSINLLPLYADHDDNIAYDYNVEQSPIWVTVDKSGNISKYASTPPSEVLKQMKKL